VRLIYELYIEGEPMSLTGFARFLSKLASPTRDDMRKHTALKLTARLRVITNKSSDKRVLADILVSSIAVVAS
jgi:hypothetical protein